ncbi:MAG: DUF4417 domain-containing protein [Deltaproteobacteria bacterium]|nr:DUF4417 domain-containing protein [Deltaproteobacteria bacterium]
MSAAEQAKKLAMFRLDGGTISVGCARCPLLSECGGYTRQGGAWSCMDQCATCDKTTCDLVCLKKPDFARALLEVGGFGHRGIPHLLQPEGPIPRYVPALQHGIGDDVPLDWAAIPLSSLMRFRRGTYRPTATSALELRAAFGLPSHARLILLGTGKDRGIEQYWRWHRMHGTPAALAMLGFTCGVVPNYSLFLEDPRPQHLFNRKRSLLCAAAWSKSGMPAIPYLQAVAPFDWRFWESFLHEHDEIVSVAKEFQTGLALQERGQLAIDNLARLQDQLGRRLHLFAIGGAQYRSDIARRFDAWTVIDSTPFMKAVKRRVATRPTRRITWLPAVGENVVELLLTNVGQYTEWLSRADLDGGNCDRRRPTAFRGQ